MRRGTAGGWAGDRQGRRQSRKLRDVPASVRGHVHQSPGVSPRRRNSEKSAGQVTNGADVILEADMAALERSPTVDFRPADPVHPKMTEILARRVPGHQIPEWWQDEHGLRLDNSAGHRPFCIAVLKA